MTRRYTTLYVFTDQNHPKRGHRYLHHFEITGFFRAKGIVKVLWKTDGKRGYVREGEYEDVQSYNERVIPQERAVSEEKAQAQARSRAEMEELVAIMRELKLDIHYSLSDYRRRKDKADSFRLEYCLPLSSY